VGGLEDKSPVEQAHLRRQGDQLESIENRRSEDSQDLLWLQDFQSHPADQAQYFKSITLVNLHFRYGAGVMGTDTRPGELPSRRPPVLPSPYRTRSWHKNNNNNRRCTVSRRVQGFHVIYRLVQDPGDPAIRGTRRHRGPGYVRAGELSDSPPVPPHTMGASAVGISSRLHVYQPRVNVCTGQDDGQTRRSLAVPS
jgi:hypothetical protein